MRTTKKLPTFAYDIPEGRTTNEQLLKDIFAQSESELLGSLFCLLGSVEKASNALNSLWTLCRTSDEIERVQDLRFWVFKVLYHVAQDEKKLEFADGEAILDDGFSQAETSTESVCISFLQKTVLELPYDERAVFILRQNGGLTYLQIANTMEISFEEVVTKMRLAVRKIRLAYVKFVQGDYSNSSTEKNTNLDLDLNGINEKTIRNVS